MTDNQDRAFFEPPETFLRIGLGLVKAGKGEAARALVMQAQALFPDESLYRELGRAILSATMHPYHAAMLHDHRRNTLYRAAIERVAKGRIVLDIGTGSGLLAMMAARAGAEKVIACEMTPAMAATARAIVEANGLSDKIVVHACHSSKLDKMRDLHGGADLVVSELIASDWVGESVQSSLEHARTHLARDGALFVPPRGAIRIALAYDVREAGIVGEVEGFDLSLAGQHLRHCRTVRPGSADVSLRSEAADLIRFDYAYDQPIAETGIAQAMLTATGGPASGIVQWVQIGFEDGAVYENSLDASPDLHWDLIYYPFVDQLDLQAGDTVSAHGFFDAGHLAIWGDHKA